MYDSFENLQKKAQKYYIKRILARALFVIALFVVASLGVYFFVEKTQEPAIETTEPPKVKEAVKKTDLQEKELEVEVAEKPKAEPIEEVVKEERIIEDIEYKLHINAQNSQKFAHHEKESPPQSVEEKIDTEKEQAQETQNRQETQAVEEMQDIEYLEDESVEIKHAKPVEIVVNRLDTLESMIAFYEKESRYSLAIEIAQKYYDEKDYENSLLWSKKANTLDRKDYKSWLLYAKSEYAKGNQNKAIEILKLYLANSSSPRIESQLLTWNKGK